MARNYSSVARATTLTATVTSGQTVWSVADTTGWPTPPFTLVADPGRGIEEAVEVTSIVGLSVSVTRGVDGTSAMPHDAGASIRHMATARDFREPQQHLSASSGVHGVTGDLVGATQAQTLDNKTFTPTVTDHTPLILKAATSQTSLAVKFLSAADATLGGITAAGRVQTPGVDGTNSSTFTAGGPGTTGLIAKGVASQTAALFKAQTSAGADVASIGADGRLTAASATVTGDTATGTLHSGAATLTGRVATPGVDGSDQSIFATATVGNTPLVVNALAGLTVPSFAVRDPALSPFAGGGDKAGVSSPANGYRLFHGTAGNYLPLRFHAGTVNTTMQGGTTAVSVTVDLSPFNFSVAPIVTYGLRLNASATTSAKRRVNVTMTALTASSVTFRVFNTQGDSIEDDEPYIVTWQAVQVTAISAGG